MQVFNNAFELLTNDPAELEDYNNRNNIIDETKDLILHRGWGIVEASEYLAISESSTKSILLGEISKLPLSLLEGMTDLTDI